MHNIRVDKYGDPHFSKAKKFNAEERKQSRRNAMAKYHATTYGKVRRKWSRDKKRHGVTFYVPGATKEQLLAIWNQPNCGICHLPVDEADKSLDHIMPIAKGGPHILENLQVAHLSCNKKKNDSYPDQLSN